MQTSEQLIAVYVDGKSYSFKRGGAGAGSIYGGPLTRRVSGCAFGPARLHHVATLGSASVPSLSTPPRYVSSLPLVYGFRFDGCVLEYRFEANEIDVLHIAPDRSADDWPYLDYPPLLPYIPIEAQAPVRQDWKAFVAQFPMDADEQPAELVAVVPPALLIGQSLWGPDGDQEGVCVVFECDIARGLVRSYNICG